MQHTKITENLGEFQKFIDSDNKTGMCLEATIGFFDIRRIFGQFDSVKQKGIGVTRIMTTLLVMLFYHSKNPHYDLLGNENVPWRVILYLFAKRYLVLAGRIVDHTVKRIKALVFDDSLLGKSGMKIEGVSRVHDHVTGRFILGYKLLVCGYWEGIMNAGRSLIRHGKRGGGHIVRHNMLRLLTRSPTERRKQFKKKRDKNSPGDERRSEADMSKSKSVIKMLVRAVRRGFEFDYVLFDSWFFSKEILACIESFRTKGIKLIAMVKMGKTLYQDCLTGKEMDAPSLRKHYKKQGKRNRKYNATYIRVPVRYDNRRLNLFFVRLGSGSRWKVFSKTPSSTCSRANANATTSTHRLERQPWP